MFSLLVLAAAMLGVGLILCRRCGLGFVLSESESAGNCRFVPDLRISKVFVLVSIFASSKGVSVSVL